MSNAASVAAAAAAALPPPRRRRLFAGVVPYGFDATNKLYLLLGREAGGRDAGCWSAFAGSPEFGQDEGDEVRTAAREAHEESLGVLGSMDTLHFLLQSKARVDTPTGTHFLLQLPYNSYMSITFDGVREALGRAAAGRTHMRTFFEKDRMFWFAAADCVVPGLVRLRSGFGEDLPRIIACIGTPATK